MNKKALAAAVMVLSLIGALIALLHKQSDSRQSLKTITATAAVSPPPVLPSMEVVPSLEGTPKERQTLPQPTPAPKLPSGISPAWSRTVNGRDDPEGISMGVAGFSYFSRLERLPDDKALEAIQKVARVDADTAAAYLEYVKHSLKEYKEFFPTLVPEECVNHEKLQTIPQIADALKRMGDKTQARRMEIIRGSERVLGAEGMEWIENHINREVKRSLTSVKVNNLEMLYSMNEAPEVIVARLCGPQPESR